MSGSLSSSSVAAIWRRRPCIAELLDERLHLGERLRVRTELRRVGLDGRVRHLGHQLVVSRLGCGQLVEHVQTCRSSSVRANHDDSVRGEARHSRRTPAAGTPPRPRLQRRRQPRVLLVDGARDDLLVFGERRVVADQRSHAAARWRRRAARGAAPPAPAISRSRAKSRIVTRMRARRRPAGAASSSGSAVAPSIQTSPPSKCSCFQIGAICLTRSIA